MGVPFRQMHTWDYSGPYHGYDGFAIFARDMDMAINSPVWGPDQGALEEVRRTLRGEGRRRLYLMAPSFPLTNLEENHHAPERRQDHRPRTAVP